MTESLLAFLAFFGGAAIALVDGRRSVPAVTILGAIVLAPTLALVDGAALMLVPVLSAAAAVLCLVAGARVRRPGTPAPAGLNPLLSVAGLSGGLFGPRSVRAVSAALALPAASWVGLNVEVGGTATASGAVFAVTFLLMIGGFRLLLARTLEDLACGLAVTSQAAAAAWLLQFGGPAVGEACIAAALAPLAALVMGILAGRRPPVRHGLRA